MTVTQINTRTPNQGIIAVSIITLLALVSLPKGGNIAWVMPIISATMLLCLMLYLFDKARDHGQLTKVDKAWLNVWCIFSGLLLVHAIVVPYFVSWNAPIHNIDGLDLRNKPVNTIALIDSWIRFSNYWGLAFLSSKLAISTIKKCLLTLLVVSIFQALYGVFAEALNQQTIIGIWQKVAYKGSATGSFVNHNHYANYLAVGAPVIIAFILSPTGPIKSNLHPLYKIIIAALFSIVVAVALIASLSRMGAAAGLLGITIVVIIYAARYLNIALSLKLIVLAACSLLLLAALSFFGIDDIAKRYERVFIYDMRWSIWSAMFDLPASMWILGSGAGSFSDVFWLVHPPTSPKTAYYAHNDYLQFLLEYGVIGTVILMVAFSRWFKIVCNSNKGLLKSAYLIALSVMAMHSTVDFSLHIPANALLFWFCLGCYVNPNINSPSKSDAVESMGLHRVKSNKQLTHFFRSP